MLSWLLAAVWMNLSLLTACEVGYFTEEEGREKCKPCPPHKYGKKCAYLCICKENER